MSIARNDAVYELVLRILSIICSTNMPDPTREGGGRSHNGPFHGITDRKFLVRYESIGEELLWVYADDIPYDCLQEVNLVNALSASFVFFARAL